VASTFNGVLIIVSDIQKKTEEILLAPAAINASALDAVLGSALSHQVDYADLFLQNFVEERWFLEDGIVKDVGFSVDRGFGLRVIQGEQVGFAYADDIDMTALDQAAKDARSILSQGQSGRVCSQVSNSSLSLYSSSYPISSLTDREKGTLLLSLDQYARALDSRVTKVMIQMSSSYDAVMVLNNQGTRCADCRPLVHMSVRVLVEEKGRIEQGSSGGGARDDLHYFASMDSRFSVTKARGYVQEAVRKAVLNLSARPVPAGAMPVVLGPGWPAVLLHEAVGHGLEADFNRKGSSVFSGSMGQQVASPLCTIIDDATLLGGRGSLNIDDEGSEGRCTVLIENGVLCGYMTDRMNASLMNLPVTGNGRRESYSCLPLPRMTTTAMLPGDSDPAEILSSLDRGIYAVDFSGGQVDITSGQFVFTMSEAYWVENGQVQYPVKGATLVGEGADVLSRLSMVGNDLQYDNGIGVCGKEGQSVPVGVGQPTLKLDQITVGGVLEDD
jgi:TldD protein